MERKSLILVLAFILLILHFLTGKVYAAKASGSCRADIECGSGRCSTAGVCVAGCPMVKPFVPVCTGKGCVIERINNPITGCFERLQCVCPVRSCLKIALPTCRGKGCFLDYKIDSMGCVNKFRCVSRGGRVCNPPVF